MKNLFYILIISLFVVGCGSSSKSDEGSNGRDLQSNSIKEIRYNKKINSGEIVKLNYSDTDIKSIVWKDEDGNILGKTRSIEWEAPHKVGEYNIYVQTKDSSDKLSLSKIIISVINNNPNNTNHAPTITLKGSKNIELNIGEEYKEPGFSAFDEEDGNITNSVNVEGLVDTNKEGNYTLTYSVTDSDGSKVSATRNIKVIANKLTIPAKTFEQIREFISAAKEGLINEPTYICIGDSTRAVSDVTHAQHYFENVSAKLKKYNFTTLLRARGGHTLKEFLDDNGTLEPKLVSVLDDIPNDGSSTIVELSLAVNDLFELNDNDKAHQFSKHANEYKAILKQRLEESIDRILQAKPKTTIYLVSPNPTRDWEDFTHITLSVYKEVSKERDLPLADFVDEVMDGGKTENGQFDDYYRDPIHFSTKGLDKQSNFVLSKILP